MTDAANTTIPGDGDKSRKFRIAWCGALLLVVLATLFYATSITLHATIETSHFVSFENWAWFAGGTFCVALGIYSPANVWEKIGLAKAGTSG